MGWHVVAECLKGDDTTELDIRTTQRHVLRIAAHVATRRYLKRCSSDNGRDDKVALLGLWVNFFFQQTNCVKAALRMGEDHNGTAVVVVSEILAPRIEHIEVRLVPRGGELWVARTERSAESGRGNRTVDRGEHATHLVETRGLHDGGVDLSAGSEVAGHRGIFARGGIHVEAIDGRVNSYV